MKDQAAAKSADTYHHGDLRRALLDLALEQVDRQGAEAISLAALARTLGVSQAAPYRHFPDRDALLGAVAGEAFGLFRAELLNASAATPRRSVLSKMCHAYVAFGVARPGLYRLMFASRILSHPAARGETKHLAQSSFALLLDALAPSTSLRKRERQAMRIWVALHGIVMLATQDLLKNAPVPITVDELIADILV